MRKISQSTVLLVLLLLSFCGNVIQLCYTAVQARGNSIVGTYCSGPQVSSSTVCVSFMMDNTYVIFPSGGLYTLEQGTYQLEEDMIIHLFSDTGEYVRDGVFNRMNTVYLSYPDNRLETLTTQRESSTPRVPWDFAHSR